MQNQIKRIVKETILTVREEQKHELEALKAEICELKSSQEFLSFKYDVLSKEFEKLNKIYKKQREDIAALNVNLADLGKQSNVDSMKIDIIEQYEHLQNLELVSVHETNK